MAGFLETAEGQFDAAARAKAVNEYLASADRLGDAMLARAILGPYARDQAEFGAVGEADCRYRAIPAPQIHRHAFQSAGKAVSGSGLAQRHEGDAFGDGA